MSRHSARRCAKCTKPLSKGNKHGLCMAHLYEQMAEAKAALNCRILEALLAGASPQEVAEALGCKIWRVTDVSSRRLSASLPEIGVGDIIAAASACAGLSREQILAKNRTKPVVQVRHAVCLIGIEAGHSSVTVGRRLGGLDHSSVLHGKKTAEDRAKRSPEYARFLDRVRAATTPNLRFERAPVLIPTEVPDAVDAANGASPVAPPAAQAAPARTLKRKNDFRARDVDDEDQGHRFHQSIAAGSRRLKIAILAARAAA